MGAYSEVAILTDEIESDFSKYFNSDKKISSLYQRARDGTATYTQANEFALEVGNLLSKSYVANIDIELMDYEKAIELLQPLKNNYSLISDYCNQVQNIMNKNDGLGIQAKRPQLRSGRIDGLAKAIGEADDPKRVIELFKESVINFSQNVVDDYVKENADYSNELGLQPQIIREYEGMHREHTNHKDGGNMADCQWCLDLAGTYDYDDVKNSGNDVYRRHEGCRCTLSYINKGARTMRRSGNAFIRW